LGGLFGGAQFCKKTWLFFFFLPENHFVFGRGPWRGGPHRWSGFFARWGGAGPPENPSGANGPPGPLPARNFRPQAAGGTGFEGTTFKGGEGKKPPGNRPPGEKLRGLPPKAGRPRPRVEYRFFFGGRGPLWIAAEVPRPSPGRRRGPRGPTSLFACSALFFECRARPPRGPVAGPRPYLENPNTPAEQ